MDFQQQQKTCWIKQPVNFIIYGCKTKQKRKTYEKKVRERNETGIEKTKTKETMQKKLIIFFFFENQNKLTPEMKLSQSKNVQCSIILFSPFKSSPL